MTAGSDQTIPTHPEASMERSTATTSAATLAPEAFAERAQAIEREVGRVIVGQRELVRQTLTGLLANSHVLLEGVPGPGQDDARPDHRATSSTARSTGSSSRPT